jgi:hypothetical protein
LQTKLETDLPRDVFTSAQERGKTLEVEAVAAAAAARARDTTVEELLHDLGKDWTDSPGKPVGAA